MQIVGNYQLQTSITIYGAVFAVRQYLARPDREWMLFSNSGTAAISVMPNVPPQVGGGILVNNTTNPVVFSQEDTPGLPQAEWWVLPSAGGATLTAIEGIRLR